MKSQKAKEFIDGCMAHLTVEMSDHAKWQLRAAMTHAAELAEQDSILTFRPIDAGDMTNDEIYNAALLAMAYKGNDAPNVAALCQAAINRRAAASTSGNAFKSCGEIGSVLQVKRANQSLFHRN